MRRMVGSIACLAAFSAAALAQESAPLPTTEQIQNQVEQGQYRPALQNLLRVLNLKGPAAEPYNRFDMLMLRAECQLQIRETKSVLDTLEQAKKEATAKADADKVGTATALALLIQRSPALKYTPKVSTGPLAKKPIDILDRKARVDAFKALFEDELAVTRQKVRLAETATKLAPVMDAAKAAQSLRAVEKAATNDAVQSTEMTETMASHAALLLANGVTDLSLQTDTISAKANTVVTSPMAQRDPVTNQARMVDISHRRGLDGKEVETLKTIQQNCNQVIAAAGDLALALPSQANAFKSSAADATSVRAKAGAVLNDDYSNLPAVPGGRDLPAGPGGLLLK